MPIALNCLLLPDALPTLTALRLDHLEYIRANKDRILFGGPARSPDGLPEEMIIVLRTDDRSEAERFIANEPYNASGRVFGHIKVRPWSQVMPDPTPGALDSAIAHERRTRAA